MPSEPGDVAFADSSSVTQRHYASPAEESAPETKNAPDLSGRGRSGMMEPETRFELATIQSLGFAWPPYRTRCSLAAPPQVANYVANVSPSISKRSALPHGRVSVSNETTPPARELAGLHSSGARDQIRTGDPHVGNVMLYQLSYSCINLSLASGRFFSSQSRPSPPPAAAGALRGA